MKKIVQTKSWGSGISQNSRETPAALRLRLHFTQILFENVTQEKIPNRARLVCARESIKKKIEKREVARQRGTFLSFVGICDLGFLFIIQLHVCGLSSIFLLNFLSVFCQTF